MEEADAEAFLAWVKVLNQNRKKEKKKKEKKGGTMQKKLGFGRGLPKQKGGLGVGFR